MKFNYRYLEGKFLPIIPIDLKSKSEWVTFNAFVDTGASFSLFHADVAEILGLDLTKGESREMVVGDGDSLLAYLHKVPIRVADKEFIATVGFSKNIGVNFFIIGRKDIFDKFLVCFNEREKIIEFKEH